MIQQKIPKPPQKKIRNIAIIVAGTIAVLYIGHSFLYGWSNLHNCIYTEKKFSGPEILNGSKIVTEREMYVVKGKDPEYCTKTPSHIENEIVNPETISNNSIGADYFTRQGRTVEILPAGKMLSVEKIITETKHGISTIDSGPGPIVFLILKDDQGITYRIFIGYLEDINHKDTPFFGYYRDGRRIDTLSEDLFEKYY